jgi:YbbR domain-containing protein
MLKNFFLIFLSLTISCVFWLAVVSTQQNIKTFEKNIPIEHFNIPESLFVSSPKRHVSIKVDASKEIMKDLSIENFQAFVDLSEMNTGEQKAQIVLKSALPQVRIVSSIPKEILIKLEEVQEKSMAIELQLEGSISEDYSIEKENTDIQFAIIHAGESILNQVDTVKAVLQLQGETSNISKKIPLMAFNAENEVLDTVEIKPNEVEVSVLLSQVTDTKNTGIKVPIVGVIQEENLFIKSIHISPSITELRAKKYVLDNIDFVSTQELDISEITKSTIFHKKITPPLGTEIIGAKRVDIEVIVENILE